MTDDLFERLHLAGRDPEAYWALQAAELTWERRWNRVFEPQTPSYRWFAGGLTNLGTNAVDVQASGPRADATAIVYRDERGGGATLSYRELHRQVERVSAALRGIGVSAGDRITLYMPACPESIVLMLAAVRIGAIHSAVFAGFGAGALADRVAASGSRWLFTADLTYRKGKDVRLDGIVREAFSLLSRGLDGVVRLVRGDSPPAPSGAGRELDWNGFLAAGEGQDGSAVAVEAGHPAFLLATSGTTARPKLVMHTHGGYQVAVHHAARVAYGLSPQDVWWTTSDIGWIVGHSYMVYGPLLSGATTVVYEGAIDHPGPDTVWRLVADLGVTGMLTSPTAIRLLMRYGTGTLRDHDVSSLRRVFSAGEVLNPAAWRWLAEDVLDGRVPVLDNMWQTETAAPVFGYPWGAGEVEVRPGSAGIPLPGTDAAVVGPGGEELPPGRSGVMVLRRPTPGLTPALWGEPERYAADYWDRVPGCYHVGDSARIDDDGYVWFGGRADEVIKIAAHRIGTAEVESALLTHPAAAEAGVTGSPDELRGEVICAFVVLKDGCEPAPGLAGELVAAVRRELGPVAVVGDVRIVRALPKTRSGKIMRRVLKAVVLGVEPGDLTTIEDEGSVDEAVRARRELVEQSTTG